MKKVIKRSVQVILGLLLIVILYVLGCLAHGTATDFQPQEAIPLLEENSQSAVPALRDSVLSFMIWNVGYGGLGQESDFFYDNGGFLTSAGKTVRAPKTNVEKNIEGAVDFVEENQVDFLLLQEVDFSSKRSYYINQFDEYKEALPGYASTFAVNYRAPRVPLPVFEPWNVMGKMESGLGTFSRHQPLRATRYQLPGEYPWPDRIFHLDRCAAFHYYPLPSGKDLVVVNVHNSAYDKGGVLKKQQMDYLNEKFTALYKEGHYLVIGGDWNQRPQHANAGMFGGKDLEDPTGKIIPKDYLGDWNWVFVPDMPTNRSLKDPYEKGKSAINLIDFFLVSPNLEVISKKGFDMQFAYSDHQPVMIQVKIKENADLLKAEGAKLEEGE